jgi:AraC-like DNA-binding protein
VPKIHRLNKIYTPITSTPFRNDKTYVEFIPCNALKPYIRCFWGTKKPITKMRTDIITEELIIPDTCMDIIFDVNYSENKIRSNFIGINSKTFKTWNQNDKEETISTFAIRLYAWTAILFSDESMTDVKNNVYNTQQHYSKIKKSIEPWLFDISNMKERINMVEKILLDHLNTKRIHPTIVNSIFYILNNKGNLKTANLADEMYLSSRQLERIFNEYIGVSPKQLASLVRYQYLWNGILFNKQMNVLDAVQRYGYSDQSHLLHDFKKYHTILPSEAMRHALGQR